MSATLTWLDGARKRRILTGTKRLDRLLRGSVHNPVVPQCGG